MPISLNYKASNIAKAERNQKKNFFSVLQGMSSTPSMDDMLFLVEAGGGTEDDFDKLFEGGIDKVLIAIFEGINEAGFLGTKIDLEAMKSEMEASVKQATKASPTSGAKTNP